MTQVKYTKEAYQTAKKTPPEKRTEEQKLLCLIDFRQGPNPVLRLSTGSVVVMRPGTYFEGDDEGNIGIVLAKLPEEKSEDEKPPEEVAPTKAPAEKNPSGLDAADFFAKEVEPTEKA